MKLNEITIEITQQCPNQCVYCSSFSCPNKTTCLSTEKILEVVDDAVALGCESISLSGGEPFLHPGLVQIVNHIAKQDVQSLIYTSGICIEKGEPHSTPLEMLEELRGKVSKYIVNVEAADEATYDKIMGTSFHGFVLMKQFIAEAVAMGEVVEAHFVPMKLNYRQIPSVVEMCNELGVSRVSFLRFVAQGRGRDNMKQLLLGKEEAIEAKRLMNQYKDNNNIAIRQGIPFSDCSKRKNCLAGTSKLNVRYDGNVYPCEAFKNNNLKYVINKEVDNISQKTLKEIYQKSDYLIKVRGLLDGFQTEKTSETCMNQFYTKSV